MSGALALLPERRAKAEALASRGLPGRRVEEWKYSDLARTLGESGFAAGPARWTLGPLPEGVELFDLARGDAPHWVQKYLGAEIANPVSAASFSAAAGFAICVRGAACAPLALELADAGQVSGLIVLEAGASLTLLERAGAAAPSRNAGIEIVLGEGAVLDHVRIAPRDQGVVVEEIAARLEKAAVYRGHFANFGATLSRLELSLVLMGQESEAHLSGVSVLSDSAHADVTTHLVHHVGPTHSSQLFKKVAGGKSRAIYQGKITVAKGADGADSRQTAKALLLGTAAEADLKPELEIFADDVKCAHGAAVGDLDADSLFYLRARGLPEAEARALLIHAFLEDALAGIQSEAARDQVRGAVDAALAEIAP
jgi:Fe-S cluster assembly protein SufD